MLNPLKTKIIPCIYKDIPCLVIDDRDLLLDNVPESYGKYHIIKKGNDLDVAAKRPALFHAYLLAPKNAFHIQPTAFVEENHAITMYKTDVRDWKRSPANTMLLECRHEIKAAFKRRCYEKYQLAWMQERYSLETLMKELDECRKESTDESPSIPELFETWQEDTGFGGQIWACLDEFLDCEYQNEGFMRSICNTEEYEYWCDLRMRN